MQVYWENENCISEYIFLRTVKPNCSLFYEEEGYLLSNSLILQVRIKVIHLFTTSAFEYYFILMLFMRAHIFYCGQFWCIFSKLVNFSTIWWNKNMFLSITRNVFFTWRNESTLFLRPSPQRFCESSSYPINTSLHQIICNIAKLIYVFHMLGKLCTIWQHSIQGWQSLNPLRVNIMELPIWYLVIPYFTLTLGAIKGLIEHSYTGYNFIDGWKYRIWCLTHLNFRSIRCQKFKKKIVFL